MLLFSCIISVLLLQFKLQLACKRVECTELLVSLFGEEDWFQVKTKHIGHVL